MAASRRDACSEVERPAGTIETGATDGLRPDHRRRRRLARLITSTATGMTVAVIDTGVDYNNPALGGGFGPGAKVIAGYDFADGTSQSAGDHVAARHGHRRIDRLERPRTIWASPRRQDRRPAGDRQLQHASLDNVANALQWVINNHSAVQHHRGQYVACPTAETTPRTGLPPTAATASRSRS